MALTNDEVLALLAKGRVKGQYEDSLKEFEDSDDIAVNPKEAWPMLYKTKELSALYQGFINAKKKMNGHGEHIRVMKRDEEVFLINMDKVSLDVEDVEDDADDAE